VADKFLCRKCYTIALRLSRPSWRQPKPRRPASFRKIPAWSWQMTEGGGQSPQLERYHRGESADEPLPASAHRCYELAAKVSRLLNSGWCGTREKLPAEPTPVPPVRGPSELCSSAARPGKSA